MMTSIDLYCERIDSGLLSEPLNAATNVAFIVAGLLLVKKSVTLDSQQRGLIALLFIIGIGSFLFHTFATSWARLLDVVPIIIFQILFIWVYLRTSVQCSLRKSWFLIAFYLCITLYLRRYSDFSNGSFTYIPSLIVLIIFAFYHYHYLAFRDNKLIYASIIFGFSLFLRTIDNEICNQLRIGTHFMWHILNSITMYLCVSTILSTRRH